MTRLHCRLLPTESLNGVANMAADDAMLQSADSGIASLRFYTWNEPTLSLGYFQPESPRRGDPLLADVAWVRRPSGGAAILHHRELTYCLSVPSGADWQKGESWVCRIHRCVAEALTLFGGKTRLVVCGEEKKLGDFLCFLHQTPGDLVFGTSKVAGSAQRKLRGALMQHGSILLERSPHTPSLPGIIDLSGQPMTADALEQAVLDVVRRETGWLIHPGDWTVEEKHLRSELKRDKYSSAGWNAKR